MEGGGPLGITGCTGQGKKDNHACLEHPENYDLRKDTEATGLYLTTLLEGRTFSYTEEPPKDMPGSQV